MNKKEKKEVFFHCSFFPKNRRGSHVGVIISFVVFVTFLLFLYSLLEANINPTEDKDESLNHLEKELTEMSSSELVIISVEATSAQSCIELSNFMNDVEIGNNIVVKDDSGQSLDSYIAANDLQIERSSGGEDFLKVYYSAEFDLLGTASGSCQDVSGYTLGLNKKEEYVFESRIYELIADYENYDSLKESLEVSPDVEFGFGLVYNNGSMVETPEEDLSTNIYIKEIPIEYVDSDANILSGYLRLKVW